MRFSSPSASPFLATLGLAVALMACETSVVIDTPELEPALVVYSFPTPDSTWTARVGKVVPLGSNLSDQNLIVENADVRILEDGVEVDRLVYQQGPPFDGTAPLGEYVSTTGSRPQPGRTYRVEVSAPNYDPVYAETTLPLAPTVSLTSDEWVSYEGDGNGGARGERAIRFTLDDPAGEDIYELAVVRREFTPGQPCDRLEAACYEYPTGFESPSPSFRQGYGLLDVDVAVEGEDDYYIAVFRDNLFDGRRQSFEAQFPVYDYDSPNRTREFALLLIRVSEPFAQYQLALIQQDVNEGNPFAEPTPLSSNVVGGHGVVGGLTVTRIPLPDPDR